MNIKNIKKAQSAITKLERLTDLIASLKLAEVADISSLKLTYALEADGRKTRTICIPVEVGVPLYISFCDIIEDVKDQLEKELSKL